MHSVKVLIEKTKNRLSPVFSGLIWDLRLTDPVWLARIYGRISVRRLKSGNDGEPQART